METEFRLTGKHVLAMLIGFFLVILTANVIFINFAVRTFPGEKEEKSYLQGLNYNDRLAARAEQAALGWTATIEEALLVGNQVELKMTIVSADGAPLRGLNVDGALSRPASKAQDRSIVFVETGNGEYVASSPAASGVWILEGKAVNNRDDVFEFSSRLMLQ
ncbi:MAG: FixH family protein [Pseudomonadota bacterium]